MTSGHYIIHRLNLDIDVPDEPAARRMQDEASRILNNWVIPKLEELLERFVPKNAVLRIDKLDLILNPLTPAEFEQGFGEAVLARLSEQIEQVVAAASGAPGAESPAPFTLLKEEARHVGSFLHFLATGRLPWWSERGTEMFAEEPLIASLDKVTWGDAAATSRLISLLASRTTARERLLHQFPATFVLHLIRLLLGKVGPQSGEEFAKLTDIILHRLAVSGAAEDSATLQQRLALLEAVFRWLQDARMSPEPSLARLRECMEHGFHPRKRSEQSGAGTLPDVDARPPSVQLQDRSPAEREEPDRTAEPEKDGVQVDHAGLVLLHPFLEYYFREFDLLAEKEFRSDEARHLAMHLLGYLATGGENPPEYLLTFEKFLCGAEMLAPVPRIIRLTEDMKKESDTLLRAAIGHWQALKSTSAAGLREGFLQRPGKLVTGSFENRLVVESKAHDVLLNYLPWGCGIIKLPWLHLPLIVDWGN